LRRSGARRSARPRRNHAQDANLGAEEVPFADTARRYRARRERRRYILSGDHVAAFVGSVVVVLYFVTTPLLVRRSASKLLPWGIAARLRSPSDRYTRRVRSATWNP